MTMKVIIQLMTLITSKKDFTERLKVSSSYMVKAMQQVNMLNVSKVMELGQAAMILYLFQPKKLKNGTRKILKEFIVTKISQEHTRPTANCLNIKATMKNS